MTRDSAQHGTPDDDDARHDAEPEDDASEPIGVDAGPQGHRSGVAEQHERHPEATDEDLLKKLAARAIDAHYPTGQFPAANAGPVPPLAAACAPGDRTSQPRPPDPVLWRGAPWDALQFAVTAPSRASFQYEVVDAAREVVVRAWFDLDCDGAPDCAAAEGEAERVLLRIGIKGQDMSRRERPAANLVFLIDVSGSMQDANKLPLAKTALGMLVEELGAGDRVAIVTYAGQSGLALESTDSRDRGRIMDAIEGLQAGGGTNGSGGIQLAYEVADLGAPVAFHWDDWNATNAIVEANGLMFFFQNDGSNGRELWRSDGTALGTFLIRDLCPGTCGTRFPYWSDMAALGDQVVFAADDGVHGLELWITDGSALGTRLVADLRPGYSSSFIQTLTSAGDQAFFVAHVDDQRYASVSYTHLTLPTSDLV